MGILLYQVDAFTATPFSGNPAAVCVLDAAASEQWMQNVALEMNLSETSFVYPLPSDSSQKLFQLRWFTPTTEVDLCGHATLATAHVLWEIGRLLPNEQARFSTKSGILTADLKSPWIELDFPAMPPTKVDGNSILSELKTSLPNAEIIYAGYNGMDYLVHVASENMVTSIQPDLFIMSRIKTRGVIITSASSSSRSQFDFVSRFFAPAAGIDEDPVTGSAHCCLGPYWGDKLGKKEMLGFQASARGGEVRVCLAGNRVKLGGQAVTVLRGELAS